MTVAVGATLNPSEIKFLMIIRLSRISTFYVSMPKADLQIIFTRSEPRCLHSGLKHINERLILNFKIHLFMAKFISEFMQLSRSNICVSANSGMTILKVLSDVN